MPLYKVDNYAMAGMNSDLIPSDVTFNYLTDCQNIRAVSGGISPFGGYTDMINLPADRIPHHMYFIDSGEERFWVVACDKAIYRIDSAVRDVSWTGMNPIGDATRWSTTDLSGVPIINHPESTPMYMTTAMLKFEPLPFSKGKTWKDVGKSAYIMVSHKQFLFALGTVEGASGDYIPDSVRWSSVADVGGIPSTWDELDTTNVAGYTQLGGSGGAIIGALPLRDSLMVYRTHGISVIDYIGGQYVWRIRHLNSNIGLLAPDAVVDVRGTHYFMTDGDVYKTDGNSIISIATKRMKKRFAAINKARFRECYALHNPPYSEILFVLPRAGSEYPDVAFVYNYEYDSWYSREIPVSVMSKFGMTISKPSNWDALATDWDGYTTPWDQDASTPFDNEIMAIVKPAGGKPGKLISLSSILGTNQVPFNSIIERTDLILEDLDQATTIQQIYPHIASANKVMIQVGSQQSPGGAITWKPPVVFDPNKQRKVDMRTTGILHAYRIFIENVKTDFTISGIDILYTKAGRR